MKAICAAWLSAVVLTASPADACVVASGEVALLHSALPNPLPADTIIAEVDILPADESALYGTGIVARVKRLIQGDVPGNMLVLRQPYSTSCDRPFANGRSGYLIAVARDRTALGPLVEGSGLLVEPFPAQRGRGFRMRDGETIPPEWRQRPPGW